LTQLTEEFVKNHVLEWLSKKGYGVIKVKTMTEHGEDIRARKIKSRNYFIVECKGDPPGKNPEKIRHGFFVSGLGEVIQRVRHEKHYRYGLAFPESYRQLVFKRVPWVGCKRLGVEFLLVSNKGKVERITWRDLKEPQIRKD